jgi:WD40 repeat protein
MLRSFQHFRKLYPFIVLLVLALVVRAREDEDAIFLPHPRLVSQVEWSPDGTRLAANLGSEIHIFNTETWERVTVISDWSSDIAWHPDSQLIAGVQGGESERLFIWDTNTSESVRVIGRDRTSDAPRGVTQPQTLAWHPDGNIIATDATTSFDEILLWDISKGLTPVLNVAGGVWHNSTHLVWSHNGEMLLSSGADDLPPHPNNYMTVTRTYILDAESGETLFSILSGARVWSPDDERIVTGSIVDTVRRITIWHLELEEALLHFDEHKSSVVSVAWNTYSPIIASADIDDNLYIWNADTGITYDAGDIDLTFLRDLAWKPDSNILAIAGNEGVLIKSYDFD